MLEGCPRKAHFFSMAMWSATLGKGTSSYPSWSHGGVPALGLQRRFLAGTCKLLVSACVSLIMNEVWHLCIIDDLLYFLVSSQGTLWYGAMFSPSIGTLCKSLRL